LLENCALLSYYAVSSGNSVPKFRDNLLKMGPICCPEMWVRNYHHSLEITQKSAGLIYFVAEAWNHKCVAWYSGENFWLSLFIFFFSGRYDFHYGRINSFLSLPTLILSCLHSHSGRFHSKITRYNIFLRILFCFICAHEYVSWFKYQMLCGNFELSSGERSWYRSNGNIR